MALAFLRLFAPVARVQDACRRAWRAACGGTVGAMPMAWRTPRPVGDGTREGWFDVCPLDIAQTVVNLVSQTSSESSNMKEALKIGLHT
jgi:hypothetical protein